MKFLLPLFLLAAGPLLPSAVAATDPAATAPPAAANRAAVEQAITKGLAWLKAHQNPDGSWSSTELPALTALPLISFLHAPGGNYGKDPRPEFLEKGLAFLRSMAKPDGSIFDAKLSNYNTSVCLLALLANHDPKDEVLLKKARDFIVGLQAKGMVDESLDGGIGYGATAVNPQRAHPDLDNTYVALEALRAYKDAHPATEAAGGKELNFQAAIDFITRCQNLPEKNPKGSKQPADRGGFVYYPGDSNAAPEDGSDPLRSYGTMTYAGLLSFIYADLKKDDTRVQSALDWLKKNYTVDQNPNMGPAGLYFYLHLMSKGLTAAGIQELDMADGRKIDWASDAARKFVQLQTADGSWVNQESARWMEKDPVLVTSYSIMALELLYPKLK
jgi:squalene-hopene/tetraprenyl-beta-curcumene cyclase